jgi:serine/threonine protein kinase
LLDFGLAKWVGPAISLRGSVSASEAPTGSHTPTLHSGVTTPGAVIGTLQYMAPEQLEGVEADARTDIFAFGVVLYEMVTGRKAFEGKTQVLLISAIATADPLPPSKTEPAPPPVLDHVVETCLAKNPADRWQSARDLLAELQWIHEGGAESVPAEPVTAGRRKREKLFRIGTAAFVLLAVLLAAPASRSGGSG